MLSTGISKESEAHSLIPSPSTMHDPEDSQLLWTNAQPLSSPCETGRKLTAQPGPDSWPWADTGEIAEQSNISVSLDSERAVLRPHSALAVCMASPKWQASRFSSDSAILKAPFLNLFPDGN